MDAKFIVLLPTQDCGTQQRSYLERTLHLGGGGAGAAGSGVGAAAEAAAEAAADASSTPMCPAESAERAAASSGSRS